MEKDSFESRYFSRIKKVCYVQIISNVLLTILKFIAGIFGKSSSLISDGVNSFGDILTSSTQIIANKEASKKADDDHQFGHEKIENLICMILATIILFSAIVLVYFSIFGMPLSDSDGIIAIAQGRGEVINKDELLLPLFMAVGVVVIKFSLSVFTFFNYKKTNSEMLKSQAIDHITDCIGTAISILATSLIYCLYDSSSFSLIAMADPIASIVIAFVIGFGAFRIIKSNASLLLDKACDKEKVEEIKKVILENNEVLHVDSIISRLVSARVFLEIEISCSKDKSFEDAHKIAEDIKREVEKKFPEVKHVMVHVNPSEHEKEDVVDNL